MLVAGVAFDGSDRKDARYPLSNGASNHPPFASGLGYVREHIHAPISSRCLRAKTGLPYPARLNELVPVVCLSSIAS